MVIHVEPEKTGRKSVVGACFGRRQKPGRALVFMTLRAGSGAHPYLPRQLRHCRRDRASGHGGGHHQYVRIGFPTGTRSNRSRQKAP
jgi:hypothetical protein